jgi:hypothetical protein
MFLPQNADSGSLEPQSDPAPTMHTLDEIYEKLNSIENTVKGTCTDCTAPVPKTGQTNSYGPRDDGQLQKGVLWEPSTRFTHNNDGTITDILTGLVWTKNANCDGDKSWDDALTYCNTLSNGDCGLQDNSVPGDWRLPNVRELQSLIDYGRFNPALPLNHPFENVQNFFYWVSSTTSEDSGFKWTVTFRDGILMPDPSSEPDPFGGEIPIPHWVWCVRDTQ